MTETEERYSMFSSLWNNYIPKTLECSEERRKSVPRTTLRMGERGARKAAVHETPLSLLSTSFRGSFISLLRWSFPRFLFLGTRLLYYLSRRLQCRSRIINAVPSLLAVPFWIVEAQSINRAVSTSAVRLERGDKKRKETGERRGKNGLHSLL